jgi:hypothetical protein
MIAALRRGRVGLVWMACGASLVSLIQAQKDSNEEALKEIY